MKKLLLMLVFLSYYFTSNAQFSYFQLLNSLPTNRYETPVPNSEDATIVKTANIDLPNNTNLIGIVWSNINDEGFIYVADHTNTNVIPNAGMSVPITSPAPLNLDPGYEIGDVDIAMVPRNNNNVSNYGSIIKIIYQRRLNNTLPWEVVIKTFVSSSLTGITNLTLVGAAYSLGNGKHVSIDAFVHVDKASPSLLKARYDFFAIGWGTPDGFALRVLDLANIIVDSTLIPYAFPATMIRDDTVRDIDIAAVRNVGVTTTGTITDDAVYIACASDDYIPMYLDVWRWEVDYSMLTNGALTNLDFIYRYNYGMRLKIDAMSVQDINLNEPCYYLVTGEDCSSNMFHTYQSGVADYYFFPYNFHGDAYDICAGIGYLGNQTYVANRHYNVIRESFSDYMTVSGIMRQMPFPSYSIGGGDFATEDLISQEDFTPLLTYPKLRIKNNNDTYNCGGSMARYSPKILDNLATSSSFNSGRCILNAWTQRKFAIGTPLNDPTYKIYYKIKESFDDLNAPAPGLPVTPPTHWSTKAPNYLADATIRIFPNPATDVLTIQHDNSPIKQVSLLSIDGKMLAIPIELAGHTAILDIRKLATGNYQLTIALEDGKTFNKRFVKE